MSKRLRSLMLIGALSVTFLTGCQSTETEPLQENKVDITEVQSSQDYFKQIQFKISEEMNSKSPESVNNLIELKQEVEQIKVSEDEQLIKDLLIEYLDKCIEYIRIVLSNPVEADNFYRTQVYHLEGSYLETLNSDLYPQLQIVEPLQPVQPVEVKETKCEWCEEVNCECSCYSCGTKVDPNTAYYNGRSFRCESCYQTENQPAEVELSDERTHCSNCHSTNIDVVDNTGSYICLDCDYWE